MISYRIIWDKREGVREGFIIYGYALICTLILMWRYLFVPTVMVEERVAGWMSEPVRVAEIVQKEGEGIEFHTLPVKEKRAGSLNFIFKGRNYPFLQIAHKEKRFPFLFAPYVGPLYIYIPRFFLKTIGENIFAVRIPGLLTFFLFLVCYLKYAKETGELRISILSSLFLILHPLFGMKFLSLSLWNHTCVFLSAVLLGRTIYKILKGSVNGVDILKVGFLGGIMCHFHLLAGGALFASMCLSMFISMRKYNIHLPLKWLFLGILCFFIFVFPFISLLLWEDLIKVIFIISFQQQGMYFLLGIFLVFIKYALGLLFPASLIHLIAHGEFNYGYGVFSLLPGLILLTGFYSLFKHKRDGPYENFLFWTVIGFLILSFFIRVQPYHVNYFLIFLAPFVLSHFQGDLSFISDKLKWILIVAIVFNFLQTELAVDSIKNSAFSFKLHKEIAKYIETEGINKIYNLAGRYGYEFISKRKIDVVDFWDYIETSHNTGKIVLSLLVARGGVIMVEKYKEIGWTTGISLEEVQDIGRRIGLKVIPLKRFPEEGEALIWLARVE